MYRVDRVQNAIIEPFSLSSETFLAESAWIEIANAKQRFCTTNDSSALSPLIRPSIRESWVRSKNTGVRPDTNDLCIDLQDEEFERIEKKYDFLTQIVAPLMSSIERYDFSTDYNFELMTRKGVSLLRKGRLLRELYISDRSLLNESTMGTNAHSLCMRHKKLFYILGPEHYCDALAKLATIAVPLVNQQGTVVASLVLTQLLPAMPWTEEFRSLMNDMGAALVEMATAIESDLTHSYSEN